MMIFMIIMNFTLGFEFQFCDMSVCMKTDPKRPDRFVTLQDDVRALDISDRLSLYGDYLTSGNDWVRWMRKRMRGKVDPFFFCLLPERYCESEIGFGTTDEDHLILLTSDPLRRIEMPLDKHLAKNFNELEFITRDPVRRAVATREWEEMWGVVWAEMRSHLMEIETWWRQTLVGLEIVGVEKRRVGKRARDVSGLVPWRYCFLSEEMGLFSMQERPEIRQSPFHAQMTVGMDSADVIPFVKMMMPWLPSEADRRLIERCLAIADEDPIGFCCEYSRATSRVRKQSPFFIRHRLCEMEQILRPDQILPEDLNQYDEEHHYVGSTIFPIRDGQILMEVRFLQSILDKELGWKGCLGCMDDIVQSGWITGR